MQIPSTNLLLPLTSGASREPLLQNLKPGQILQGTALSGNVDGRLNLQIGITRLIAQTQLSVRPGQSLILQVVKSDGLPELRVITPPSLAQLKAAALKTLLPRQQSLSPLFKMLGQIATTEPPGTPLPKEIRQQVESLLSRAPALESPEFRQRLQRALGDSGLLTESKLLQRLSDTGDLKLDLARLFRLLRPLIPESLLPRLTADIGDAPRLPSAPATPERPPDPGIKVLLELLKQIDGAISRIQTHQLHSLPREDGAQQVWQFELPIRNGQEFDLFHFRITREGAPRNNDETASWTLVLHMNLATLGPMRVQLRLQGEALSTVIWSQKETTHALVHEHLEGLRKGYERSGLEVQRLEAFLGAAEIPEEIPEDTTPLLHEKA